MQKCVFILLKLHYFSTFRALWNCFFSNLQVCKHSFFRLIEEEETKEQLENLIETHGSENIRLVFYFKFGTDGSSGHIVANQIGSMENSGKLMSSNMIILQLVAFVEGQENPIIIHTNQLYNSEISNRPLGHQYIPETTGM